MDKAVNIYQNQISLLFLGGGTAQPPHPGGCLKSHHGNDDDDDDDDNNEDVVYEKDENNDNIVYENNETKVAGGFPASSGPLSANPCKVEYAAQELRSISS